MDMRAKTPISGKQFVLKPGDRIPELMVVGVKVQVLVSEESSNTQQITLQSGDEGAGPPPHSHGWDESFYITRGQVTFNSGGKTTMCSPGTLVFVPAGTIHAFSFGPGGGEMLEFTGAGSNAVKMFTALDRQIPPGPPDIAAVKQVGGEYGLSLHL
jgi:quercetin dioxygenase-like cupin family protein